VAVLASAALLLGVGGVLYGYGNLGSLEIGGVTLDSVSVVPDGNGSSAHLTVRFGADLSNPSGAALILSNVRFGVFVGGVKIGEAKQDSLVIGPGVSKHVNIVLNVTDVNASRALGKALSAGKLRARITVAGEAPLKWFGVARYSSTTINVSKVVDVNVGKYLEALKARESRLSGHPLTATSPPPLEVIHALWVSGNKTILAVSQHVPVTVTIKFKATGELHSWLEVCVYQNIRYYPDQLLGCHAQHYDLAKGEVATLNFTIGLPYYELSELSPNCYAVFGVPKSCEANAPCSTDMSYVILGSNDGPKVIVTKYPLYNFSVIWESKGHAISSASIGERVTAKIKISSTYGGRDTNFRICVKADIANAKDKEVACISKTLSFDVGTSKTLEFPFYVRYYDNVRGYFIDVKMSNPDKHWSMPDSYPPRLKLSSGKPSYRVSSVEWLVNGKSVSKVVEGQDVEARITISTDTGLFETKVKFCVKADKAGLPDADVKCGTATLTVPAGGTYAVTIPFKAEHYARIRGYFVEVSSEDPDYSWHQKSDYPPRLRYVSPSYRVDNVKWVVGGRSVTSVNSGTWVDAKITIKTDTGLAGTSITFCIREDIAHGKDHDTACVTKNVYIPAGSTYTVTIHFQANYHKKSHFFYSTYTRGYFVTVRSDVSPSYSWEMSNHYPPRLKVRS